MNDQIDKKVETSFLGWCLVITHKLSLFGMLIGGIGLLTVIIPDSDKERAMFFGGTFFGVSVAIFVLTAWIAIKLGIMSLRKWTE